ncbi:hypothetical protein CK203_048334 [Vitis vinifera]|uniref:Uncharacterized protein n=1 Tax=Vitis vinifera TaxID=29760 RepID=A0A438HRK5_VITVI|nr:hypothetical protein CK203_048334 [Vitis vinifera]
MASMQEALPSLKQEIAIWDDLEGMLVASLPVKFRMPDIERGLWIDSSPTDVKGKKPFGDRDQLMPQVPHQTYNQTYMSPTLAPPHCAMQEPEPIVLDEIHEIGRVTLGHQMPTPFRLVPEVALVQTTTVAPLTFPHYSAQTPFVLIPNVEKVRTLYVDDARIPDIQYVIRGGRVSTQPRISIRSLLASSITHRDALIQALSQIRVETTTTPEGLIHMVMVGRAICIVFFNDDLPPEGLGHTCPLYISIDCLGLQVPYVLLDNGSVLNVCPLAIAIALGYAPSDFGPSTQTVRAYDSTQRKVLRIPTSFNLLLGRPWIHRARVIPSFLHQKVKFIHDGQVVTVQYVVDMFISSKPVLQISHSDDDLFLIGFTFDELDDSGKERAIYYLKVHQMEHCCRSPASLPFSDGRAIDDDFPYEDVADVTSLSGWRMYFDGAANHSRYGIGVLLISPHGDHIPRSVCLAFLD